jgi:hypothetical protein
MKLKLIAITLILLSTHCYAEKWVYVDSGFYIDTDSKKTNGDLTDILIKSDSMHGAGWITFDCKRKTILSDNGTVHINKNTVQEKVLIAACKKSWEIWK